MEEPLIVDSREEDGLKGQDVVDFWADILQEGEEEMDRCYTVDMKSLKDILSGMFDNTIFPLLERDECADPPSDGEGIASYWNSVGNYLHDSMRSHEQKTL